MEKNLGMLAESFYNGVSVRSFGTPHEPWFALKDVCDILELGNPSMVAKRLDDDEKGITTTDTLGGEQELLVVSEPGLYSVIFQSRKPEAKAFRRWVTHEVLPSIRKQGYYAVPSIQEHIDALIHQTEMYHYEVAEKILGVKINGMADWNRAKKLEHDARTVELEKERGYRHTFASYFGKCYRSAESVYIYNLDKKVKEKHTSEIGGRIFMDDYLVGEIEKVLEVQGLDKSQWRKEA